MGGLLVRGLGRSLLLDGNQFVDVAVDQVLSVATGRRRGGLLRPGGMAANVVSYNSAISAW